MKIRTCAVLLVTYAIPILSQPSGITEDSLGSSIYGRICLPGPVSENRNDPCRGRPNWAPDSVTAVYTKLGYDRLNSLSGSLSRVEIKINSLETRITSMTAAFEKTSK